MVTSECTHTANCQKYTTNAGLCYSLAKCLKNSGTKEEKDRAEKREGERAREREPDMHGIVVRDPVPVIRCRGILVGKVHTILHLTVQPKMPDTYQTDNRTPLFNGTGRHVIAFYAFMFSGKVGITANVNAECLTK